MLVAFVPVRGGSKSIPLKNIKELCGQPLVYWVLRALDETAGVDKIVVATDSTDIKRVVNSFGFKKCMIYDRDPSNAHDDSSTESVIIEYLQNASFNDDDIFMLVQATSPFTVSSDFQAGINLYLQGRFDSLLSVVRNRRFFWEHTGTPINYDFRCRPRRQDFPGLCMENGAFYLNRVGNIKRDANRLSGRVGLYEMPEHTGVEIDEPDDWYIAEQLMRRYVLNHIGDRKIRLFAMDVDGVLTDAGMYYSENGDELKKFNTTDGKGIELLRESGIKTAILTSENTRIVSRRAEKLKVDFLFQGVKSKIDVMTDLCKRENISFSEIAYIGDDLNDRELLMAAGLAACPQNAVDQIKSIPGILRLARCGGAGAVREFIEYILRS